MSDKQLMSFDIRALDRWNLVPPADDAISLVMTLMPKPMSDWTDKELQTALAILDNIVENGVLVVARQKLERRFGVHTNDHSGRLEHPVCLMSDIVAAQNASLDSLKNNGGEE
mgnify:CR=1 FL=1|tara:strand:- start:937 stop:1275 length:339 start_codon:yes stop_codon:yes gene_type:complete